jgi:peptide/nickel transport system ATP-binding protein
MYAALGIEKGSISEVFDHMAHPYTRGLFASLPQLDTKRGKLNAIKGSVPPITHFPQGCRFHPRCPYVMPKCCFEPIPDFRIESENHTTKCVLYDGTEESLKVLR